MPRAVLAAGVVLAAAAIGAQPASAVQDPAWLKPRVIEIAGRWFDAQPVRVDTVHYPRKIAVVLTFEQGVRCLLCGGPDADAGPRARFVRFAFDRVTHRLGDGRNFAIHFCRTRHACQYR